MEVQPHLREMRKGGMTHMTSRSALDAVLGSSNVRVETFIKLKVL